ncbi:MAG: hypothetical protein AAGB93_01395 [Planctomycetota bacterium]
MLAWLALPLAAAAAAPPGAERPEIVFTSDRTGTHQLYVMGAKGGAPVRLVETDREDRHPRWSPDGEHVAFESAGGGARDVWIVGADGSDLRRITEDGCSSQPAWSPNGERLIFVTTRSGGPALWTIDLESRDETRVPTGRAFCRWPDWSPDGERIVFSSLADGDEEIYVAGVDGSGLARLTRRPGEDSRPRWSADGTEIVFSRASPRTGSADEIVRITATGARPTALEDSDALRRAYVDRSVATWGAAPAADRSVVFASIRGGNADLYLLERGSSGARRITEDPAMDQDPDWRPSR